MDERGKSLSVDHLCRRRERFAAVVLALECALDNGRCSGDHLLGLRPGTVGVAHRGEV
jgi:hypothetical protein